MHACTIGDSKVEGLRSRKARGLWVCGLRLWRRPSALTPFLSSLFLVTCALCLVLAAYCFLSVPHRSLAAVGLYQVQEVKPHVFVWVPDDVIDQESDPEFSRAGTAGFILTPDAVVVIDTANSPFHGRELLYEIRKRSDLPVKYVINTSSAGDHILGNEVFTDQQATLISTVAAQAGMQQYHRQVFGRLRGEEGWRLQARMRGFHVTPATQTFEGQTTLSVGDQEFRLISLLRDGASSEEAVVFLPAAKTLFLGELFDNQYFPRIGSRDIHRWIRALREVEGWEVDTYVPGHGAPASKKDLADFRGFLEWLAAQVDVRLKAGKSAGDIEKDLSLPTKYPWHAPELAAEDVEAICRQLGAKQARSTSTPSSRP